MSPLSKEIQIGSSSKEIQPSVSYVQTIYDISKHVNTKTSIVNTMSIQRYEDNLHKNDKVVLEKKDSRVLSAIAPSSYSLHQNPYNEKEVMGFMPYWALSSYGSIDYAKMSTLAYFSLTCDDTGAWITGYLADDNGDGEKEWHDDGGYVGFHSTNFINMVSEAHLHGTKIILLVKNFDARSIRKIVYNTGGAGDKLMKNIVNAISSKGLDGVNIDFEYVVHDSGDTITSGLRASFASWHDKLADKVHALYPGSLVSTDTFGSSAVSYTAYDIAALGRTSLNYIVMMTYDYITTSCYSGKEIFPMSPLYGNYGLHGQTNWNVSKDLLAGAKLAGGKKILMGIPYYGIDFQVKTADKDKYNAEVDYPNCKGNIETYGSINDPIYDSDHNASTIKWNGTEKATWYSYQAGSKWRNGYYDDAKSLAAKYDFVQSANLGGIAIWAMGYDRNAPELYKVIRDKFQKVPFYVLFNSNVSEVRRLQIISENGLTVKTDLGSGLYEINSTSTASSILMGRLNKYTEVAKTDFENSSKERKITL